MNEEIKKALGVLYSALLITRGEIMESYNQNAINKERTDLYRSHERIINSTNSDALRAILGNDLFEKIIQADSELSPEIITKLHGIKD